MKEIGLREGRGQASQLDSNGKETYHTIQPYRCTIQTTTASRTYLSDINANTSRPYVLELFLPTATSGVFQQRKL